MRNRDVRYRVKNAALKSLAWYLGFALGLIFLISQCGEVFGANVDPKNITYTIHPNQKALNAEFKRITGRILIDRGLGRPRRVAFAAWNTKPPIKCTVHHLKNIKKRWLAHEKKRCLTGRFHGRGAMH